MKRIFTPFLVPMFLIGACATPAPVVTEDDSEARLRERDAILDAPVKVERSKVAAANVARMELPETPAGPAREINGDLSDWDKKAFRKFDKKSHVESGERFWSGAKDASLAIAVDSDSGYLYLAVDVTDDVVIAGDAETVVDAIVVTIRDPNLDRFVRTVPESARLQDLIKAETSLIFFPDGRYRRNDSDDVLPNNMGVISIQERKGGYVLELALQIEAFEQVGSIPLETIAFRVDVLDGDEEDRAGTQTVISMLPDRDNDDPRMALFETQGLLPHYAMGEGPPRKNAIGSWLVTEETWDFTAFERVPELWVTIDDAKAFEEAIRQSDSLNDVCRVARKDVRLLETYQSRGGGFRAGLLICGDRPVKGKCPANSKTEVFWMMMKQVQGQWRVEGAVGVFEKPLEQCAYQSTAEGTLHSGFSMFPMDMVDHNTWAVGWTKQREERGLSASSSGITIINTELANPVIGSAITDEKMSVSDSRSKTTAKVYVTYVDDDEFLDICQVEDVLEQHCTGVDSGCQTYERGRKVMTTIHMYNPRLRRFERYELSKHPGCNAEYDFAKREGFLLLQTPGRIGFLPSPSMDEGDALKLF